MSRNNEIYLIDLLNFQILLHKKFNVNKKGFINPLKTNNNFNETNLNKFITFDIESITNLDSLNNEGDITYFDPIIITAFDFYNKKILSKILRNNLNMSEEIPVLSKTEYDKNLRIEKLKNLSEFFIYFIDKKYHKFVLYAHNLAKFDIIFVLESLLYLTNDYNIKIEPIIRENKLIKLRIYYYINNNKYYIDFHDSYQLLNSSLDNLSKTFLRNNKNLQKMNNKELLNLLLSENERIKYNNNYKLFKEFEKYCVRDTVALAYIIHNFSSEIYNKFKINIHRYPTISSLGLAIYLTGYLNNNKLIPLISGEVYNDISKAYQGGHTDVYQLYSNEDVHSYDYSSMYPTQMLKHKVPVKTIDYFEGNILKTNNFKFLEDKLAFIKCSVYVDKTLNKPLYQTKALINGEIRSVCATGTFHNQWVYVPELTYYNKLTNGLIKIIPDSITKGYLFEGENIFKDYITDLYNIKQSVTKSDPWYLISKYLMNCLYGRMGLKQEIVNYSFLSNNEIENLSSINNNIKDIIEFDSINKKLVISENKSNQINLKSSVSIAAAISAYARMELAPILLDSELDILYIDTDSFKCKQKITELERYKHLDFDGLGALKYEYTLSESLFLLPKVYGGIYKDSLNQITKVKGFKDKIEFNKLKELLFKNQELKLTQNKWYRDMLKSEIKIMKSPYKLILNNNKRINDLKTFKTKPYHFDNYDPETINN